MGLKAIRRLPILTLVFISIACQSKKDPPSIEQQLVTTVINRTSNKKWFDNAKVGILLHWGLYSVPAWALPSGDYAKLSSESDDEWYKSIPYSEWYYNSMSITRSPTQLYHDSSYGADFDYYEFASEFEKKLSEWHPEDWAALFKSSGARYVIVTAKHHDGFLLWPSNVKRPVDNSRLPILQSDPLDSLARALRNVNIRFGVYYSQSLDWSFSGLPIRSQDELESSYLSDEPYVNYVVGHWNELIERYKPDILWADVPFGGLTGQSSSQLKRVAQGYLERVPEGVINDRLIPDVHRDFLTLEYKVAAGILQEKWETTRGLGFSFGYNRAEKEKHFLTSDDLIRLLVDVVSKNGNLLIGIGPAANGSISDLQIDRLRALGAWLDNNGEAIFGTYPLAQSLASTLDWTNYRYTQNSQAIYIFLMKTPLYKGNTRNIVQIPALSVRHNTELTLLESNEQLTYKIIDDTLKVGIPRNFISSIVPVIRIIK